MILVGLTHVGNVRSTNEDSVLLHTRPPYFMLVADGMGGHAAGEVASSVAARAVEEYLTALQTEALDADELVDAVQYANTCIMKEIAQHPEYAGMGTTITLAYLQPDFVTVAHVGDSRAYLRRKGTLHKITKDHTYVQRLIDSGELKYTAAARFPFRNIITRALGMSDLQVDLYREPWSAGDSVLLCSDGLTAYADAPHLLDELSSDRLAAAQAQRLLDYALQQGGRDNVSVVIAQNDPDGEAAE